MVKATGKLSITQNTFSFTGQTKEGITIFANGQFYPQLPSGTKPIVNNYAKLSFDDINTITGVHDFKEGHIGGSEVATSYYTRSGENFIKLKCDCNVDQRTVLQNGSIS